MKGCSVLPDIYFEPNYAKLHESMYNGISETFFFENRDGVIQHSFLRREIPYLINGEVYFDHITPYGYGGPIITQLSGDKERLVDNYTSAYLEYCKKHHVVSEFVRFHPLLKNHLDFKKNFNASFVRQTVATKLELDDPFQEEFSKSARKTTRQSLKKGFTWEIIEKPEDLNIFTEVYLDTMSRNEADEFYFFGSNYFDAMLRLISDHLLNINVYGGDKCIASGLYFVYKDYMHAHLSGTRREYLKDNPAYILKYVSVNWGKENGKQYIHYGGGTSNDPHDSLLSFKKKFTKESIFDFYVGKNIYNQHIYDLLTHELSIPKTDFFPAYRFRGEQ